jgi:L-threonylcarbamoyladenylate synthase
MRRLLPGDVQTAAVLLRAGELVAFPTETVYGLGAVVWNEGSIRRLFAAKRRPTDNPLIVHIAHLDEVPRLATDLPATFHRLAKRFFPGPLTLIVKRNMDVPDIVSAGLPTVALRMPAHPLARALLEEVGEPLVAPSANRSGRPSATSADHVIDDFGDEVAAVLDGGKAPLGIESTVVSLLGGRPTLLRPGAIGQEALEEALGGEIGLYQKGDPILSPGLTHRHYAPNAPLRVFFTEGELAAYVAGAPPASRQILRGVTPRDLYAVLRACDRQGCGEIVILCDDPALKRDAAFLDRLRRASSP